jgi:hypothetical protein
MYQGIVAQYTPAVVPPAGDDVKPVWWWCAEIGRGLGHDLFADLGSENPNGDDLLATLCANEEVFARLRSADGAVVDDRDVYGWVLQRGLPQGSFDAAPSEMLDQLARVDVLADHGLVLSPRRQRRHLNSVHVPGGDRQEVVLSPVDAAERGLRRGVRIQFIRRSRDDGAHRPRRGVRCGIARPRTRGVERQSPHDRATGAGRRDHGHADLLRPAGDRYRRPGGRRIVTSSVHSFCRACHNGCPFASRSDADASPAFQGSRQRHLLGVHLHQGQGVA